MFLTIIIALLFLVLLAAAGSIIYWTIRNGISPMPTSSKVAKILLNTLPEKLNGTIYELGSGWGTLAVPLAKKYPQNSIKAYENSLIPYLYCRLRLKISPQPNLTFHRSDFFTTHLNDASLIVCYLYPGAMQKLKPKFEQESLPGTLLITNTFSIPGLKPIQVTDINDIYNTKIFLYRIH